jgi:hypothetical protein
MVEIFSETPRSHNCVAIPSKSLEDLLWLSVLLGGECCHELHIDAVGYLDQVVLTNANNSWAEGDTSDS